MNMGYPIDENSYQYESAQELAISLGIDLDTIEGDYAEAYQHAHKFWDSILYKKFNFMDEK